jgi:predicted nucleic acid-binding protein
VILVDSSVWIAHLRGRALNLAQFLIEGVVLMHPFVAGELACGTLKHRGEILADFNALPSAVVATRAEVMQLIESRRIWGKGIGWIDAHLLTSALLSRCELWTLDQKLYEVAARTGVSLHR